jgi:hypothetical protein
MGKDERIDFAELLALGARVKARRMRTDDAAVQVARKRLAEMIRTRSFPYEMDVAAADEAKHRGLAPRYE